jgi:hypothetical protein
MVIFNVTAINNKILDKTNTVLDVEYKTNFILICLLLHKNQRNNFVICLNAKLIKRAEGIPVYCISIFNIDFNPTIFRHPPHRPDDKLNEHFVNLKKRM